MNYNTTPLVSNGPVRATWLPGDRFWYRNTSAGGSEFFLVDAVKGTKAPAFNHAAVAAALTTAMGKPVSAAQLPFQQITFAADSTSFSFDSGDKRWTCDVQGQQCTSADRPRPVPNSEMSPDGKHAAYIKDYNLWVRDMTTGADKQLTTDGIKDYGYATDNAGWISSDRPVLKWSPDSKKIATFQQDQRKAGDMYLVNTTAGHPTLRAWKYPLPGDENVTMIERVVIEIDGPKVVRLKMDQDQHRSTLCDDVKCGGDWVDVQWSPDGSQVAFVSTSRNHQQANLRVADAGDRRNPRRPRGKGRDLPRVGQWTRQLEIPAGLERGDLVLAARELGAAVPSRLADRQVEASDHERRRQRHAAAARRRADAHRLLPGRRQGSWPRSVLPALLSRRAWTASRRSC